MLYRQPTGQTTWYSLLLGIHFATDQLVGLLITWASSSAMLGAHQLCWGLLGVRILCASVTSYVGDSSVPKFFMQASPAKLGTPLVVGSSYVSSVCYQVAPCCSDQGADLGQHNWGPDTNMSDDVGKLSDLFSLTLLQNSFLIF